MAYLGRRGALAPVTSADIPDNSITAAKIVDGAIDFQDEIGFLENKATTQNLSGTYSTERMYLNDSYTLTGDVTVTGHLALGTVADADVVITQDSTERTITGSGTLESGELLSSKQTDLTGMTGELGSVVTGSPNLNLGNTTGTLGSGVTFPVGHVVQTFGSTTSGMDGSSTGSYSHPAISLSLTGVTLGNKILVSAHGQVYHDTGSSSTGYTNWYLEGNTNSGIGATTNGCPFRQEFGRYGPADWVFDHLGITVLSGACTTATPTYQLYNHMTNPNGQTVTMFKWYLTAQEIQQ